MKIRIVYEDEAVLVCQKPAGFAVQAASALQTDAVSELKNYLARNGGGKNPYLGVIHRLDQPVEGLLVFAKTKQAAAELSRQLADGRLRKKYLALLRGIPDKKQGLWVDHLKKTGNTAEVVPEKMSGAKRAALSYKLIKERKGISLAEIELETGRFHQIRAQAAHRGYPLLGDRKYGSGLKEAGNVALLAHWLDFIHPITGKSCHYEAEPENPLFKDFLQ